MKTEITPIELASLFEAHLRKVAGTAQVIGFRFVSETLSCHLKVKFEQLESAISIPLHDAALASNLDELLFEYANQVRSHWDEQANDASRRASFVFKVAS